MEEFLKLEKNGEVPMIAEELEVVLEAIMVETLV